MNLSSVLHDDEVTLITVVTGAPDEDGIPTRVETETSWVGVNVQQQTAKELVDQGRDLSVTTWRVSGPPIIVDSGDLIRWRGKDYRVDSEPDTRTGAHRIEHTKLYMIRETG